MVLPCLEALYRWSVTDYGSSSSRPEKTDVIAQSVDMRFINRLKGRLDASLAIWTCILLKKLQALDQRINLKIYYGPAIQSCNFEMRDMAVCTSLRGLLVGANAVRDFVIIRLGSVIVSDTFISIGLLYGDGFTQENC